MKPSIISEFSINLPKDILRWMALTLVILAAATSAGLYFDRLERTRTVTQAIASALDEPVENYDTVAIYQAMEIFLSSNPGTKLCLKILERRWIEFGTCSDSEGMEFSTSFEKRRYTIGVELPYSYATLLWPLLSFLILMSPYLLASRLKRLSRQINEDIKGMMMKSQEPAYFAEINDAKAGLLKLEEQDLFLVRMKIQVEIAAQVAHDIRAPLGALRTVKNQIQSQDSEISELFDSALTRIHAISSDLLQKPLKESVEPIEQVQCLYALVFSFEREARALLHHRPDIELSWPGRPQGAQLNARVHPDQFLRILSNLLTNSVEAIDSRAQQKRIEVSVSGDLEQVSVVIRDSGHGIPPEILSSLGSRGVTCGKPDGNGLGLYSAFHHMKAWSGSVKVGSEKGVGTTIQLKLPRTQ